MQCEIVIRHSRNLFPQKCQDVSTLFARIPHCYDVAGRTWMLCMYELPLEFLSHGYRGGASHIVCLSILRFELFVFLNSCQKNFFSKRYWTVVWNHVVWHHMLRCRNRHDSRWRPHTDLMQCSPKPEETNWAIRCQVDRPREMAPLLSRRHTRKKQEFEVSAS